MICLCIGSRNLASWLSRNFYARIFSDCPFHTGNPVDGGLTSSVAIHDDQIDGLISPKKAEHIFGHIITALFIFYPTKVTTSAGFFNKGTCVCGEDRDASVLGIFDRGTIPADLPERL